MDIKKVMIVFAVFITALILVGNVNAEKFNGRYSIQIPNNLGSNLVYNYDGYFFETYLDNLQVKEGKGKDGNVLKNGKGSGFSNERLTYNGNPKVKFNNILNNVNLEIIVNEQELKENIILNSKPFNDNNKNGEVSFTWRLDIDNRLEINTNGVTYQLTDNFETNKPIHFYHEGVPRFTFPQPYAVDNVGKRINLTYKYESTAFLGIFFKRSYLSVVVPREYLVSAVYPVVIDPTAVTGCSTTSTEVQCWNGIFYGNYLNTTLNISIQNATIDGSADTDLVIESYDGYIDIYNSSLYGYSDDGGTNPADARVRIVADEWINLNDTTILGDGSNSCNSGNGFVGCQGSLGSCYVISNNGNINLNGVSADCSGGNGRGGTNNGQVSSGFGGTGFVRIQALNGVVNLYSGSLINNNTFDGNAGTSGITCRSPDDTSGSRNGVSGSWSLYGNVSSINGRLTLTGNGGNGVKCVAGGTADGGDSSGTLDSLNLKGTLSLSNNGGIGVGGGNYGSSIFTDVAKIKATQIFESGSSISSLTGITLNSTIYIRVKEFTLIDTVFSMTGDNPNPLSDYINLTTEPSRFGLFGTSNISNNGYGNLDVIADEGQYLIAGQYNDPQLNFSNDTIIQFRDTLNKYYAPYVNLSTPNENAFVGDTNISFVCGAEGYYPNTVTSVELYHNGSGTFQSEGIVYTSGNVVQAQFYDTLPTGNYVWSCYATDSVGNSSLSGINRTLGVDVDDPIVQVNTPTGTYNYAKSGQLGVLYLTYNLNDTNLNTSSCVYEYPVGVFNNFTCNSPSNISLNVGNFGDRTLTLYASDNAGNTGSDSISWDYYIFENSQTYNSQTVELDTQEFQINISLGNTSINSAFFWYNNTRYPASISLNGNNVILFTSIIVPNVVVDTNFSFFWQVNLNSPTVNTTLQNQTVVAVTLDNCSVNSILVVNYTLVDEETEVLLNQNSTIEVSVLLKTLIGSEVGEVSLMFINTSYAPVCINTLLNSTLLVDITTSYIASDYVQEFWFITNGTLTSTSLSLDNFTTKNVTLRALKLVDSQTFLFKYWNEKFLFTSGTVVSVLRKYIGEGEFKEIERCKLDNNGQCHLHLVEEDVIYKFRIMITGKEDYLSGDYNAKCIETPCSITLQKGVTIDDWDIQGDNLPTGTYNIETDRDNRTVTLTFNLEETGEMQLDVFVYSNVEAQDVLVGTGTTVAKTGSVNVFVPLSYGNQTYYAVVRHNDGFVSTAWVNLNESGYKYFGKLGLFLASLLILSLGLIAVSSGGWTIVFVILGLLISSITKLMDMDYYLLMFLVSAGALIIWKLSSRRSL